MNGVIRTYGSKNINFGKLSSFSGILGKRFVWIVETNIENIFGGQRRRNGFPLVSEGGKTGEKVDLFGVVGVGKRRDLK